MEAEKGPECLVIIYDTMTETEKALAVLAASRFPLEQISFASQHLQSDTQRHGFASTSRKDEDSPWYGGLFGVLLGVAFVTLPGSGLLIVAGPLAVKVKAHLLDNAPTDALLASLSDWGVRAEQVATYKASLKDDKHLLVTHGSGEQLTEARRLFNSGPADSVKAHGP